MEKNETTKVRTRMEAMLEMQALTQDAIVLEEIRVENARRTVQALMVQRKGLVAMFNDIKNERQKKAFQKNTLSPYDDEMKRNESDGINAVMQLESSKKSLEILERMIAEENNPELKAENEKKEEEGMPKWGIPKDIPTPEETEGAGEVNEDLKEN